MKRTILIALLLAGCSGSGLSTSKGPNGEAIVGNEVSVQISGAADESSAFTLHQRYSRKNDRAARFVNRTGTTAAYDCVKTPYRGYSSPIAVDRGADGGEDQRGRPTEHQRTASRPHRAENAVARRQHDVAVTKRREGDEREVEGIVVALDCAKQDEEARPQSDLCKMAKEQRHHGAERDPEHAPKLARTPQAATDDAESGQHNSLCHDLQGHRAAHHKKDCCQPAHA